MPPIPAVSESRHTAFRYRDFRLFQSARFLTASAAEMQAVAVAWQVYEISRRPLDLGLVGLMQFLPGLLLFLVSGHTADRVDRRRILICCYSGFAFCSALLVYLSFWASFGPSTAPLHKRSCRNSSRRSTSPTRSPGGLQSSRRQPFWDRLPVVWFMHCSLVQSLFTWRRSEHLLVRLSLP
jgi:MFS family permease